MRNILTVFLIEYLLVNEVPQAPVEMKGTLMSFWLLTTAVGNLGVARASTLLTFTGAPLFFFWAGAATIAAIALALIARGYVMVDRYTQKTA